MINMLSTSSTTSALGITELRYLFPCFRQATASGLFAAVVRYNQRGVGRSAGSRFSVRNLRGQEDAADVLDIIDFVSEQILKTPPASSMRLTPRIYLVGYSFGASLAAQALDHPSLACYIGISFPLGGLSFLLQTKAVFDRMCLASHLPRLLVVGAMDQYTKEAAIDEAVRSQGGLLLEDDSSFTPRGAVGGQGSGASGSGDAGSSRAGSRPLLLKVYPGNDHFWGNDCALMVENCLAYCEHIGRQR